MVGPLEKARLLRHPSRRTGIGTRTRRIEVRMSRLRHTLQVGLVVEVVTITRRGAGPQALQKFSAVALLPARPEAR